MTAQPWIYPDPTDPHPDCGHEWHGADGGACPGCGWDSHPIPDRPAAPPPLMPWDAIDDCGKCAMVAALGGPMRSVRVDCPVHGFGGGPPAVTHPKP